MCIIQSDLNAIGERLYKINLGGDFEVSGGSGKMERE